MNHSVYAMDPTHHHSTTWFTRFSKRARSIIKQKNHSMKQNNIYNTNKDLPSPPNSNISSKEDDYLSMSPSTSISSFSTIKSSSSSSSDEERKNHHYSSLKSDFPPSPTLSACDHQVEEEETINKNETINHPLINLTSSSIHHYTDYFHDRPLPTKRRSPGRFRHSTFIDHQHYYQINPKNDNQNDALNQLAKDTLLYLVESSSSSSTSFSTSPMDHADHDYQHSNLQSKLINKLKHSNLTDPSSPSIHPSVLKLAEDTLAFFNEINPSSNECQKLKSKLNVCLMLHGY
ncbi:unnamed protein product [Cunninghamella blakesleeana]